MRRSLTYECTIRPPHPDALHPHHSEHATVARRPPAIVPIHGCAPACFPSSMAPFIATHPPPVTNRLSDFDSSRRVEPWRVGECSLTCEGRFFVVMHRTAIVLPQPMAVVQIEGAFLQLIDSQDFFLWCISGQGTPFLGAMRVWGRLPHFSHRVIHSFCA